MAGSLGRVWLATAALCAGTWFGSREAGMHLAAGVVVCGVFLLVLRRRPGVAVAAIILVCVGAGALNAQLRLSPRGPLAEMARDVPRCDVRGSILESTGLGTLVEVTHLRCGEWTGDSLGVASIPDEVGQSGAGFAATGWLVPLRDDDFDRARRRAGAQASLHITKLEIVTPPHGPHAVAARVRAGLHDAVANLDPRRAALLQGLTIGDTSGLAPETIDVFRNAGLSHVLAVSGSNVAIVLGAVLIGLRSAGLRARILLGYIALGVFVLVVGPDASVLRAGVMGAITLACLTQGRTAEPLAALGLAIITVICLRPGMLFSAGMQLSAAATAGIVIFCDPIARRLTRLPETFRLMLAATLAAQLAVAPILILVFGELSLIAPVANALALPAVGPATVMGLAAGVASVVLPGLGRVVAAAVSPAAWWILAVADRLGGLGWSLVHVPPWVGWPALVGVAVLAGHILRRGEPNPLDRVGAWPSTGYSTTRLVPISGPPRT